MSSGVQCLPRVHSGLGADLRFDVTGCESLRWLRPAGSPALNLGSTGAERYLSTPIGT